MCFFVIHEGREVSLALLLSFLVNKIMVCPMDNKTKDEKNKFGTVSTMLFLIERKRLNKDEKIEVL